MELFLLIAVLVIGTRYAVRYNFHLQKKTPSGIKNINPLHLDKDIFLKGIENISIESAQLQKIISILEESMVGAKAYIHTLLAAYIAKGHVIVQGPPGTGKTLLVKSFAQICDLSYHRIQCTPDLLPQDILGSEMLQKDTHQLTFIKGPIFANVVHVDEINRTTPKLQSAFLEGMQEGQVTAFGKTYQLPEPFFLIATQNPYDAMGTYLLPYAQVDRFMVGITTNNIDEAAEIALIKKQPLGLDPSQQHTITKHDIETLSGAIDAVHLSDDMLQYAVSCIQFAKTQGLQLSVRTSQSLVSFVKAIAYMQGHNDVTKQDIQLSLLPILKHRVDYLVGSYVGEEKIYQLMIGALRKDDIVG